MERGGMEAERNERRDVRRERREVFANSESITNINEPSYKNHTTGG